MTGYRAKPSLGERVSALRGSLQSASRGGEWQELCRGLVDLCAEIAAKIDDLEETQEEIDLYLETIDEDLARLERSLYGTEDDESEEQQPALESSQAGHGREPLQSPIHP